MKQQHETIAGTILLFPLKFCMVFTLHIHVCTTLMKSTTWVTKTTKVSVRQQFNWYTMYSTSNG